MLDKQRNWDKFSGSNYSQNGIKGDFRSNKRWKQSQDGEFNNHVLNKWHGYKNSDGQNKNFWRYNNSNNKRGGWFNWNRKNFVNGNGRRNWKPRIKFRRIRLTRIKRFRLLQSKLNKWLIAHFKRNVRYVNVTLQKRKFLAQKNVIRIIRSKLRKVLDWNSILKRKRFGRKMLVLRCGVENFKFFGNFKWRFGVNRNKRSELNVVILPKNSVLNSKNSHKSSKIVKLWENSLLAFGDIKPRMFVNKQSMVDRDNALSSVVDVRDSKNSDSQIIVLKGKFIKNHKHSIDRSLTALNIKSRRIGFKFEPKFKRRKRRAKLSLKRRNSRSNVPVRKLLKLSLKVGAKSLKRSLSVSRYTSKCNVLDSIRWAVTQSKSIANWKSIKKFFRKRWRPRKRDPQVTIIRRWGRRVRCITKLGGRRIYRPLRPKLPKWWKTKAEARFKRRKRGKERFLTIWFFRSRNEKDNITVRRRRIYKRKKQINDYIRWKLGITKYYANRLRNKTAVNDGVFKQALNRSALLSGAQHSYRELHSFAINSAYLRLRGKRRKFVDKYKVFYRPKLKKLFKFNKKAVVNRTFRSSKRNKEDVVRDQFIKWKRNHLALLVSRKKYKFITYKGMKSMKRKTATSAVKKVKHLRLGKRRRKLWRKINHQLRKPRLMLNDLYPTTYESTAESLPMTSQIVQIRRRRRYKGRSLTGPQLHNRVDFGYRHASTRYQLLYQWLRDSHVVKDKAYISGSDKFGAMLKRGSSLK